MDETLLLRLKSLRLNFVCMSVHVSFILPFRKNLPHVGLKCKVIDYYFAGYFNGGGISLKLEDRTIMNVCYQLPMLYLSFKRNKNVHCTMYLYRGKLNHC